MNMMQQSHLSPPMDHLTIEEEANYNSFLDEDETYNMVIKMAEDVVSDQSSN